MRRLRTYPALASITLPASAIVLGAHDRGPAQAASLVVSFDDADEQIVTRRFVVLRQGDPIPHGAQYVESWRRYGCGPSASGVFCLFELVDDVPPYVPAEAADHWRTLHAAGFTLRADKAWLAPADVPAGGLSRDQIIAVAELQAYGFGAVVHA